MRGLLPYGIMEREGPTYFLVAAYRSTRTSYASKIYLSLKALTWTTPPHVCCISMSSTILSFFLIPKPQAVLHRRVICKKTAEPA